ncbi:MAG: AAA family ATPase [Clostridia bacterium]|nr:AAA family ATPase [Clostridia bacterium]
MIIKLKNITLKNFKSIEHISLDFNGSSILYGDNGIGKTTIFDGFMYALFNCDSKNRSEFAIKTLNLKGEEIPDLDHEADITLDIDGKILNLTAGISDKWQNNGKNSRKYKGNEHYYKINGVNVSQSKYRSRISEIIREDIFKMLTNTDYFCSMNWQEARKLLMELCNNTPFTALSDTALAAEADKYGYDPLHKSITDKITAIRNTLDTLPIKREELKKSIEYDDFSALDADLKEAKEKLESLKETILGRKEYNTKELRYEFIGKRMYEIRESFNIKYQAQHKDKLNKIHKSEIKIASLESDKTVYAERLSASKEHLPEVKNNIENTAKLIIELEKSVLDESKLICPLCGRHLTGEKRVEKIAEFNRNKESSIKKAQSSLLKLKDEKKELENYIEGINSHILRTERELKEYNKRLEEYKAIKIKEFEPDLEYLLLEGELEKLKHSEKEKLREEYDKWCERINILNIKKFKFEQNQRILKRINKNISEEKKLKKELKDEEKRLKDIHRLMSLKAEYIEKEINSHFSIVKFKLFKKLINGNIEDCCIPMVKGVPYKDLNSAMKTNCGIDIINTLSSRYNLYAPVFIDNRESITNLIESPCQIIGLSAEKGLKNLVLKEVI